MTRSLYEAAIAVLEFFDGEQPPERAKVLRRLRIAAERAEVRRPPADNPYSQDRLLDAPPAP